MLRPALARGGAVLLVAGVVAALVGFAANRWAEERGMADLLRDASFADHHEPPPDPRSEDELEALRKFPAGAVALQPLIDAVAAGGTLQLEAKVYAGPGRIERPLRIQGIPGTIIDGGGIGSILTVSANDVMVAGVALRNSGSRHETTDAAFRLRARNGIFRDNTIEDCLFGFDLRQADGNILRRNRIASKDFSQGLRGDAIRIWYSNENRIEDNSVSNGRDVVLWYGKRNRISRNRIINSRYGIHLMYAHDNILEENSFLSNTVGIFLMYANRNTLLRNKVHYSQGPSGIGIGFKESSDTTLEDNEVFANARGVFLDHSPFDPDSTNRFRANSIAYNGVAVAFHADLEANHFESNAFFGNHTPVSMQRGRGTAQHLWQANHWDDYQGFDRNRDGIGDTPHESWSWADRLWMDVPDAQFFRATPALEAIDFIERLGSLSEPRLLLRDDAPRLSPLRASKRSAHPARVEARP